MTKSELINRIAAKCAVKKSVAKDITESIFDEMEKTLLEGEKVQITGFGTFEVKQRRARRGRNPYTGESIDICAVKHLTFSAGKTLKRKVKNV